MLFSVDLSVMEAIGVNPTNHGISEIVEQVYKKTNVEGNVVVITERAKTIATTLERARVGIMGEPSAEFVAGMWGTWLSGAIAVPLALNHPEAELLHVLVDAVCFQPSETKLYQNLHKAQRL